MFALKRRWVTQTTNGLVVKVLPGILGSKPQGASKVNSAFHPSEVDQMSTRKFWGPSGKK